MFPSVTDYLQSVTELGTPKNMAVALPGMTLQPLYSDWSEIKPIPKHIWNIDLSKYARIKYVRFIRRTKYKREVPQDRGTDSSFFILNYSLK